MLSLLQNKTVFALKAISGNLPAISSTIPIFVNHCGDSFPPQRAINSSLSCITHNGQLTEILRLEH